MIESELEKQTGIIHEWIVQNGFAEAESPNSLQNIWLKNDFFTATLLTMNTPRRTGVDFHWTST